MSLFPDLHTLRFDIETILGAVARYSGPVEKVKALLESTEKLSYAEFLILESAIKFIIHTDFAMNKDYGNGDIIELERLNGVTVTIDMTNKETGDDFPIM